MADLAIEIQKEGDSLRSCPETTEAISPDPKACDADAVRTSTALAGGLMPKRPSKAAEKH